MVASAGYSSITQDGKQVSYRLSLEYAILAKAVDLGPDAASATDDAQREDALEAGAANLEEYLYDRVVVGGGQVRSAEPARGLPASQLPGGTRRPRAVVPACPYGKSDHVGTGRTR